MVQSARAGRADQGPGKVLTGRFGAAGAVLESETLLSGALDKSALPMNEPFFD